MFERSPTAGSGIGQRSNVPPKRNEIASSARGWLRGRKQAAVYCGLSTRTINRWMAQGVVKYHKLSPKLVMFRPADLDTAIESIAQQYEGIS